ncbi:MAG TPA: radical SAM protein [Syntrophomonadaceae bacterium]|nr:radical SAM protein [Syntrophomonadaceae bacterium]
MNRHINIPIFIPHLGCPFDCIFCNQKKISSTINPPEPSDVGEIIERHLKTIAVDSEIEVAFFGGSFTAIDEDLQIAYLEAVKPYLKSGDISSIRISTRPDFIDKSILELLNQYGVKTIELGVQSLSDEVLKKSCRAYKKDDVFKAVHLIKAHNFNLGIQLMIGLPGDNYELDMLTTKETITLLPDMVRIYPTLVIRDTDLAMTYDKGLYEPLSLDEAVTITKHMYLQFRVYDINVIRMGLYPSEDLLSDDTLIAGPFHSAFGELVMQEIFYDQAEWLVESVKDKAHFTNRLYLYVNPRDISKMIGNKKQNISKLKKSLQIEEIIVKSWDSLEQNSIGISADAIYPEFILTREEYLEILPATLV